jgi:hypothetical protein
MTTFVNAHFSTTHGGVERAEAAVAAVGRMRQGFDGTRSIAALLLAAVVAGLLVVADRLVDSWASDQLFAAWVVLWAVAFAALALFAAPARRLAGGLMQGLDGWSQRVAQSRADERLWATAQSDPRVMSDLMAAVTRSEAPAPRMVAALQAAQAPAVQRISLREVIQGWYRDVEKARAEVAVLVAKGHDPRVKTDLIAAATRDTATVPTETLTLMRAEEATLALREAARVLTARRIGYYS